MKSLSLLLLILTPVQAKEDFRQIIIPTWMDKDKAVAAVSFTLNTIAHAPAIRRPVVSGNTILVDLNAFRIDAKTWDSLHSPYSDMRVDWFIVQALDTSYYKFMRFPATLDGVLKTVGASVAESRRLNGDQRVGMTVSSITAKPRVIEQIQGRQGRANSGSVWITRDLFDENVRDDPFYNLLHFTGDASETIFERANGMHAFVLANAQGKLVAEAPPNVASDHTVPAPRTKILRAGISCIRCHAKSGGLQPAPNHVKLLFKAGVQPIKNRQTLLDLYGGDFNKRLRRGREDYSFATRQATSTNKRPKGYNVSEISQIVSVIYDKYHEPVTAKQAALELGITTLNQIKIADPTIAAMQLGIPVRRQSWEAIYGSIRKNVAR